VPEIPDARASMKRVFIDEGACGASAAWDAGGVFQRV
jgi:hypothetical protein